jgi:hypothetical protein
MEEKSASNILERALLDIGMNGIVVFREGDVWGPFSVKEEALAWAYRNCKDGIFSLKIIYNPSLMD